MFIKTLFLLFVTCYLSNAIDTTIIVFGEVHCTIRQDFKVTLILMERDMGPDDKLATTTLESGVGKAEFEMQASDWDIGKLDLYMKLEHTCTEDGSIAKLQKDIHEIEDDNQKWTIPFSIRL